MKNNSCAFCNSKTIKNRTIVKNALAFAFPTETPIVPGHILICPTRHASMVEDLTDKEFGAIFNLRKLIRKALVKTFNAKGFNYAWNEGKIAGQSVPHLHLHVVPRKQEDKGIVRYKPRKFLYRPGPRPISPEEELISVSKLVKKAII